MARRTKNVVDYFPHSVTHGKTLKIIESIFGLTGYAVMFKLFEQLGKSENHYIDVRTELELEYLMAEIGVKTDEGLMILDSMAKLGSINKYLWKKRVVFSQNFLDNIIDVYDRRTNKCMQIKDICKHLRLNVNINEDNVDINPQSKLKETKEKKTKVFIGRTIELNNDVGLTEMDVELFNLHWVQTNENSKVLHFEKQKTFDHKRRMQTWKKNSENYGNSKRGNREDEKPVVKRNYTERPD